MMNSLEEKSLPQKISEDIISLILEENLQPGDKLPNETILSERLKKRKIDNLHVLTNTTDTSE